MKTACLHLVGKNPSSHLENKVPHWLLCNSLNNHLLLRYCSTICYKEGFYLVCHYKFWTATLLKCRMWMSSARCFSPQFAFSGSDCITQLCVHISSLLHLVTERRMPLYIVDKTHIISIFILFQSNLVNSIFTPQKSSINCSLQYAVETAVWISRASGKDIAWSWNDFLTLTCLFTRTLF